MRSGFTLIEALVALVLFQIAALALGATTAVAARDLAVANRHTRANVVARDRVARVRSSACASPTAGSQEHPGGIREQWRVEAQGQVRVITDSVTIALPRGRVGSVVVRVWEVCP
jgi:Tfp pilus assembly protein PilV